MERLSKMVLGGLGEMLLHIHDEDVLRWDAKILKRSPTTSDPVAKLHDLQRPAAMVEPQRIHGLLMRQLWAVGPRRRRTANDWHAECEQARLMATGSEQRIHGPRTA